MRMKLFTAPTMQEAMSQMRAEMGEAALILSSSSEDGHAEIRAAIRHIPKGKRVLRRELELVRNDKNSPGVRHRLMETLRYHNVPVGLSDMIIASAMLPSAGDDDPQSALARGIARVMHCRLAAPDAVSAVLITGLPGSGKTSIVARHGRVRDRRKVPPEPISLSGNGDKSRLASMSGRFWLRSASGVRQLRRLLSGRLKFGNGFILDGPGVNPYDPEQAKILASFLEIDGIEPVLALSAEGTAEAIEDNARAFAAMGVNRVILTRIDLARRLGPALSAISSARLSLDQLSLSSSGCGGLVSANHRRLARLLLETVPDNGIRPMLKGVA